MLFACELCGGALDAVIIAIVAAAWGYGAYMLGRIFGWLRKKPCIHPNRQSNKWLSNDNTPMVASWCPDCGWRDEGHVHADPATWLKTK